jgi:hypothetical protein
MLIEVYFKNGNLFKYTVESAVKAREHAKAIWDGGYRVKVGNRHEWYGPHYIDKIAWEEDDTPLAEKYKE